MGKAMRTGSTVYAIAMGDAVNAIAGEGCEHDHALGIVEVLCHKEHGQHLCTTGELFTPLPWKVLLMPLHHCESCYAFAPWGALPTTLLQKGNISTIATGGPVNTVAPQGALSTLGGAVNTISMGGRP